MHAGTSTRNLRHEDKHEKLSRLVSYRYPYRVGLDIDTVDESAYEDDQHAKDLEHQPSIARHARIVFEQFSLCTRYVPVSTESAISPRTRSMVMVEGSAWERGLERNLRGDVCGICVYALDRLTLLCHHACEL